MKAGLQGRNGRIKHTHEILFSLNIGLAIAILLRVYLSRFGPGQNKFSDYALRMIGWINCILHLRPRNQAGVELTFLSSMLSVAVFVLLFLGIMSAAKAGRPVLGLVGGVTAIVAVPSCILYAYLILDAGTMIRHEPFLYDYRAYLVLENAAAAACLVLYLSRKWPIPKWGTMVLFTVHYVLWGWVTLQLLSPVFWALTLSAVPLCSGLAWALYVRHYPAPGENQVH